MRSKRRPRFRDEESRNREDRSCGDAFSDGAGGSGNIFFEQRSLPGPQHRHGDDGCRIGRGDGDAGTQTEIGIGRAENYRQDQPHKHGAEGQLLHLHGFGDVGAVLTDGSGRIPGRRAHWILSIIRIFDCVCTSSGDGAPYHGERALYKCGGSAEVRGGRARAPVSPPAIAEICNLNPQLCVFAGVRIILSRIALG